MFKNPIVTVIVIVVDNDTVKTLTEANINSTIDKTVDAISRNKKGFKWSTTAWAILALVTWAAVATTWVWPIE